MEKMPTSFEAPKPHRKRRWSLVALALALMPFIEKAEARGTPERGGVHARDAARDWTKSPSIIEDDKRIDPAEEAEFKRALSEEDEALLKSMKADLEAFSEIVERHAPQENAPRVEMCPDTDLCNALETLFDMSEHTDTLDALIEQAEKREYVVLAIHEHVAAESAELKDAVDHVRRALLADTNMLTRAIGFVYGGQRQ